MTSSRSLLSFTLQFLSHSHAVSLRFNAPQPLLSSRLPTSIGLLLAATSSNTDCLSSVFLCRICQSRACIRPGCPKAAQPQVSNLQHHCQHNNPPKASPCSISTLSPLWGRRLHLLSFSFLFPSFLIHVSRAVARSECLRPTSPYKSILPWFKHIIANS